MLYGPARAEYPVANFSSPVGIGMFSTGFFIEKVIAQIFLRLYIYEFLSKNFKTLNIENRHYELYFNVTAVMQIFIIR